MTQRAPAEVGMALEEVDTPALLIDLEAFEHNLKKLADYVARTPVKLRPHAKAHKSPLIAHKQIALGAVGVCAQKVSEAEALAEGGVPDIYVSNEVISPKKIARLAAMARQARIATCVDRLESVAVLSDGARAFGVELRVLVEIDVGAGRCGVGPGEDAVPIAKAIAKAKGLMFGGLQAYHGRSQHFRTWQERESAIKGACHKVDATVAALKRAGLGCPDVTGGGTGTYPFEVGSGIYTELQAGSYIFMDADYGQNKAKDGGPFVDFAQSLHVLATIMSAPTKERMITDAGTKSLSVDSGMPLLRDFPAITYAMAGDEHGRMEIPAGASTNLKVGERVFVVPSHCDTTVGLHDWFVGVRGGKVEAVWPIPGRGAVQ